MVKLIVLLCYQMLSNLTLVNASEVIIINAGTKNKDFSQLLKISDEAKEIFEKNIQVLDQPITIVYDAPACLRTGYDLTKKVVQFCNITNIIDLGIESADVIRHELFHAMICQIRPDTCRANTTTTETTALHEAMADFFAWSFSHAKEFGTQYSTEVTSLRTYKTSLCYSLVDGAHEKGNALVSALISAQLTLKDLKKFIINSQTFDLQSLLIATRIKMNSCFQPQEQAPRVTIASANYPISKLNRFYIQKNKPLEINFNFNDEALKLKNIQIQFLAKDGLTSKFFAIRSDLNNRFSYTVESLSDEEKIEKIIAQIYSRKQLIGTKVFYFASKH